MVGMAGGATGGGAAKELSGRVQADGTGSRTYRRLDDRGPGGLASKRGRLTTNAIGTTLMRMVPVVDR